MSHNNNDFNTNYNLNYLKHLLIFIIIMSGTIDNSGYRLPDANTLAHAAKLGIVEDKPILLDYWTASLEKTALIGVKEDGEKLLVKSEDEYTSPVAKIFKVGNDYIVMTENSIYLIDVDIPSKRISA